MWCRNCLHFRAPEVAPGFFLLGSCCSIFSFLRNVLQIVVWTFVLFLLAIVLSVLRFTTSDYLFCIVKLFLYKAQILINIQENNKTRIKTRQQNLTSLTVRDRRVHVITFLVQCYDVSCDFRVKKRCSVHHHSRFNLFNTQWCPTQIKYKCIT